MTTYLCRWDDTSKYMNRIVDPTLEDIAAHIDRLDGVASTVAVFYKDSGHINITCTENRDRFAVAFMSENDPISAGKLLDPDYLDSDEVISTHDDDDLPIRQTVSYDYALDVIEHYMEHDVFPIETEWEGMNMEAFLK